MTQKRKHPVSHKGVRNPDRQNGKAWKKGVAPQDRKAKK
jgi:hypothetical protein